MKPPEVVVFDLGKVLVDFDYGITSRKIAARSTVTTREVQQMLDHSPLLLRYETGLLTLRQFFAEVCSLTGFRGDLEEFARIFGDIFTPMEEMIKLHAALRQRRIPTYIFSNTNEMAVRHIRQNYPFFGDFDGYILSYEHGAMKPDAKLYEVVEQMTGRRQADIIYLDDRPENIAAGAARGWRTVWQQTPGQSWAALRQAGLVE